MEFFLSFQRFSVDHGSQFEMQCPLTAQSRKEFNNKAHCAILFCCHGEEPFEIFNFQIVLSCANSPHVLILDLVEEFTNFFSNSTSEEKHIKLKWTPCTAPIGACSSV